MDRVLNWVVIMSASWGLLIPTARLIWNAGTFFANANGKLDTALGMLKQIIDLHNNFVDYVKGIAK